MKENNGTLIKLTSYSAVATSIIAVAPEVNAAIVGYDLVPDSFFAIPLDTGVFAVNINNVGSSCDDLPDFNFTFNTWASGTTQYLWVLGYNDNKVYANQYYVYPTGYCLMTSTYPCYLTTYTYWTANVFNASSSVGPSNNQYNFKQWPYVANGYTANPGSSWGDWGNQSKKYIGLKFKIDSNIHYGWIYMDVGLDVNYYTVRAWAYNETPDEAIIMDINAVDWQQPCLLDGLEDRKQNVNISVYSFDNNIRVNLNKYKSPEGRISVYSIDGKKIHSRLIQGNENSFSLNGFTGLYIVRVDVDGMETKTSRIYLN